MIAIVELKRDYTAWRASPGFWEAALAAASRHGWKPTGSRGAYGASEDVLPGFHFEGQSVSADDALSLADALQKALAATPDTAGQPRLFRWQFREKLRSLADFVAGGEFFITGGTQ